MAITGVEPAMVTTVPTCCWLMRLLILANELPGMAATTPGVFTTMLLAPVNRMAPVPNAVRLMVPDCCVVE